MERHRAARLAGVRPERLVRTVGVTRTRTASRASAAAGCIAAVWPARASGPGRVRPPVAAGHRVARRCQRRHAAAWPAACTRTATRCSECGRCRGELSVLALAGDAHDAAGRRRRRALRAGAPGPALNGLAPRPPLGADLVLAARRRSRRAWHAAWRLTPAQPGACVSGTKSSLVIGSLYFFRRNFCSTSRSSVGGSVGELALEQSIARAYLFAAKDQLRFFFALNAASRPAWRRSS